VAVDAVPRRVFSTTRLFLSDGDGAPLVEPAGDPCTQCRQPGVQRGSDERRWTPRRSHGHSRPGPAVITVWLERRVRRPLYCESLRGDDARGLDRDHTALMIEVVNLTKRYGPKTAVDDLSFAAHPGIVTGFLGPNGAGKSTTMRMILGLDAPNAGHATVNGRPLAAHRAPLAEMGALLEAKAVHPRRSARNHLLALAATTGIPVRRVDEVIGLVGLEEVADQPAGGFSLGMGQRLGIASALLGDPETVMLDEPVNGLDPEGILWIRNLLKRLAAEGRTVFVSSHLMSEMALTAEHFVIIGRGRLIADVSSVQLEAMASEQSVRVRTPDGVRLREVLATDEVRVINDGSDVFTITGLTSEEIGSRVHAAGIVVYELTPRQASLEETFMELTQDAVEYHAHLTVGEAA
jgi:ABC-2 type transport system ATP-binding protein